VNNFTKPDVRMRNKMATATVLLGCLTILFGSPSAHAFFGPDNYYECLLARLPGTANDAIAQQVIAACRKDYPSVVDVEKKSGIFEPTPQECAIKKGKDTPSNFAGRAIVMACYRLYDSK